MLTENIQEKLKHLPEAPGVYKMLDKEGKIIYIGKSKCLKKRVSSYFVKEPVWEKARKMSPFIRDIDYVVTDTHLDAMLMECRLIKEVQPYFNAMMKNDNKYVYLVLEHERHKNPLKISYTKTEGSFGPLRSKGRTEEVIKGLAALYPLKIQRNGRINFTYHIFPVKMDIEIYEENKCALRAILTSPSVMEDFISGLNKEMETAAEQQKYEFAKKYRDLAAELCYLERGLNKYRELVSQDVVYTVPLPEGCKMFYISNGLVLYSEAAGSSDTEMKLEFACRARKMDHSAMARMSEKEIMDYQSIVYAELSEADEEMIQECGVSHFHKRF